jgi:Phage portal protein
VNALFGIPGDNTYSNYQEANRVFWRGTVLPLASRIGASLAHWLSPAFGGECKLAVDADSAPALAKDRAEMWEQVGKAGFLTVNEKREAIGYSPVEGDDRLGQLSLFYPPLEGEGRERSERGGVNLMSKKFTPPRLPSLRSGSRPSPSRGG